MHKAVRQLPVMEVEGQLRKGDVFESIRPGPTGGEIREPEPMVVLGVITSYQIDGQPFTIVVAEAAEGTKYARFAEQIARTHPAGPPPATES